MVVQILAALSAVYPFLGSDKGCNVVGHVMNAFYILPNVATVVIFSLRTFAVYRKNFFVLALLLVLGAGNIACNVWVVAANSTYVASPNGPALCVLEQTPGQEKWRLANYVLVIAFELAVFVLTTAKTIGLTRFNKGGHSHSNLAELLLRDGTIYFFSALILVTLDIIIVEIDAIPLQAKCVVIPFVQTLTAIIVNRLVLNLRQISTVVTDDGKSYGDVSTIPQPSFASNILGNIGEPFQDTDSLDELESAGRISGLDNTEGQQGVDTDRVMPTNEAASV